MHVNYLPRMLLRFWWLVLAVTVLVAAAAFAVGKASASYTASTTVSVVGVDVVDATDAERTANFIRGEVSVYQAMLGTPELLGRAIELSGVDITAQKLAKSLVVASTGQVLGLTVSSASPDDAAALVTGVANALVEAIDGLHAEAEVPIVRAVAMTQLPSAAQATSSSRTLVLGVLLGLVLGCAAAVGLSLLRGRVGSAAELARITDQLVLGEVGADGAVEAGRRIRTLIEGRSGGTPRLVVVAGVAHDDAAREVAAAVAGAFAEDGHRARLVVDGADIAAPAGVAVERVDGVGRPSLDGLAEAGAVTVLAARGLESSADTLRAALRADQVLLAADRDDRGRAVLAAVDTVNAGGGSLAGIVVTR